MKRDYKIAILRVLAKASQPLDVEKIRVGCNIGNWNTALKHCLELQYEGKIQGTKTSKSWIFWAVSTKQRKHPITDGIFQTQKNPSSVGGFSSERS